LKSFEEPCSRLDYGRGGQRKADNGREKQTAADNGRDGEGNGR
jgi:hypothetical protein